MCYVPKKNMYILNFFGTGYVLHTYGKLFYDVLYKIVAQH